MKTHILSACLLCGLAAATAQTQPAFVGIQTENPQGVLHIDGASSGATTNPLTGTINPVQASDDVVIDTCGRLGAGVLEPAAKVDIYADTPGGAIRIKDGTEGDRKVLTSGAGGVTSWTTMPGTWWYAALSNTSANWGFVGNNMGSPALAIYEISNYESALISTIGQGAADPLAGTITVPFTGKYRVLLSTHCTSSRSAPFWQRSILYVAHSGSSSKTSRWTPSLWGASSGLGVLPFFSTVLELEEGDVLSIALDASETVKAPYGRVMVFGVEFLQ